MLTTAARFATSKIISKVRSAAGSKVRVPSGWGKWLLAAAAAVTAVVVIVVVLIGFMFTMATAASAPLRAAADVVSKIPLVGEPLSDAIGGDDGDTPSEEDLEDIRAEAEEAGITGDAEMTCMFELPDATATATPLYIRAETDEQRQQRLEQARKYGLGENAELVSYDEPLVEPGTQLSVNGRATSAAKEIAATVPYGTHAAVARAYLVTALAGGVTGFDQFSRVTNQALDNSGQSAVTPDLAAGVAAAFFPAGTDLSAFYKLADSLTFTLHQQGGLSGQIDFTTETYQNCSG